MQHVLVIDNYDSFTYNLVHYLEALNCKVEVKRNNQITLTEIEPYNTLILSPGPGVPEHAGLLKPIIKTYAQTKKILGVCLGHQAIAEVFGGTLFNLKTVYHGVASTIQIIDKETPLFKNIKTPTLQVGRYHSWGVERQTLPSEFIVTSVDENNQIMSIQHKKYALTGVQFHPESVLTPQGKQLLKNWLES